MAIKSKRIKQTARQRRKLRISAHIRTIEASSAHARPRLSVYRSTKHMYAQVIADLQGNTVAAASTLDEDVQKLIKQLSTAEETKGKAGSPKSASTKSTLAARAVGQVLASRCLDKQVKAVVFDRNGFLFHGRVKALADGAREKGLEF